jgi:predicted oxidoreductase
MERMKLSVDTPEMSAMAYGVWRLADDPEGASPARVRAKIDACLEAGITTFDHADIYGMYTCEALFGAALAEAPGLRDCMEIITKCGIVAPCGKRPDARVKHYDVTADAITACVDRSLANLQTDYIDLLLIHRPDVFTDAADTAEGLQRVIDAGKVRAAGVSNYTTHQFDLLAHCLGRPLATNQVEISLLHMNALYDGTLDQCQRSDVHPQAWSPLAGGRIMTGVDETSKHTREALESIGKAYDATADQMALAWVAALPSRPQLIIGTNKLERIATAADSARIQLDRQHWFALWEAAQGRKVP